MALYPFEGLGEEPTHTVRETPSQQHNEQRRGSRSGLAAVLQPPNSNIRKGFSYFRHLPTIRIYIGAYPVFQILT